MAPSKQPTLPEKQKKAASGAKKAASSTELPINHAQFITLEDGTQVCTLGSGPTVQLGVSISLTAEAACHARRESIHWFVIFQSALMLDSDSIALSSTVSNAPQWADPPCIHSRTKPPAAEVSFTYTTNKNYPCNRLCVTIITAGARQVAPWYAS
jgi:hypothetical protein